MDLAAAGIGSFGNEERRRTGRVLLGIALSILMHGALLTAWRGGQPVALPGPPRPITVRVRPPPVPPPRVEAPEPSPPAAARKPERPVRAARPKAPPVIAVPPGTGAGTGTTSELDPFVVEQPAPAPAQTPRFDREAARRSARALANMRDPAKEGTAVGQFPEKPLETETRAARAIGAARRRDCKDGVPGGLLAPLLLALDKKDSGCQW